MALDLDRVALILIDAVYFGDEKASERWGITLRTIQNYRSRLNRDEELSQLFTLKKDKFESNWAEMIPVATRGALSFIHRASIEADPKDPAVIHAMAGALKIVAEIGLTKEVIDARLGKFNLPERSTDN